MIALPKDKKMYARSTVYESGGTMSCTQAAKNLSEVIEQELGYSLRSGRVPAQINVRLDESYD